MGIWYDDKTNKQKVEDLEDTDAHEVLYNLTEDILCLQEHNQKLVDVINDSMNNPGGYMNVFKAMAALTNK